MISLPDGYSVLLPDHKEVSSIDELWKGRIHPSIQFNLYLTKTVSLPLNIIFLSFDLTFSNQILSLDTITIRLPLSPDGYK